MSAGTPATAPGAAGPAGPLLTSRVWRPDEVDLFMYSAVTWLTHRIHFDLTYARSEGYDSILVHGPMQGSYLGQMLFEYADAYGGSLVGIAYRHHRPTYCNDSLTCVAHQVSVDRETDRCLVRVALQIRTGQGEVATSGTATLDLPADRFPAGVPAARGAAGDPAQAAAPAPEAG